MPGEICRISDLEYNIYVPQDSFSTFIFSLLCTNYLLLSITVAQLYLFVLENSTLYMKVIFITMRAFLFIFLAWLALLIWARANEASSAAPNPVLISCA